MNCVRDAKSDQMKNEQQTAVIDDQNGEERKRGGPQKDRGKQGGRGNKAGIGRATVGFNEDVGNETINAGAYYKPGPRKN